MRCSEMPIAATPNMDMNTSRRRSALVVMRSGSSIEMPQAGLPQHDCRLIFATGRIRGLLGLGVEPAINICLGVPCSLRRPPLRNFTYCSTRTGTQLIPFQKADSRGGSPRVLLMLLVVLDI